jgi:hypothetical protein
VADATPGQAARDRVGIRDYTCGICGEQFGSNCAPGDIQCTNDDCEARLCPCCEAWFTEQGHSSQDLRAIPALRRQLDEARAALRKLADDGNLEARELLAGLTLPPMPEKWAAQERTAPGPAETAAELDGLRKALHAIKLGIAEPSPRWVAEEALNGRYFDPMTDSGIWNMNATTAPDDGKTSGQLLHESLCESAVAEFGMPLEAFESWDQMRESQRKRLEAAAQAAATGQARLAREAAADNIRLRGLLDEAAVVMRGYTGTSLPSKADELCKRAGLEA